MDFLDELINELHSLRGAMTDSLAKIKKGCVFASPKVTNYIKTNNIHGAEFVELLKILSGLDQFCANENETIAKISDFEKDVQEYKDATKHETIALMSEYSMKDLYDKLKGNIVGTKVRKVAPKPWTKDYYMEITDYSLKNDVVTGDTYSKGLLCKENIQYKITVEKKNGKSIVEPKLQ